MTNFDQLCAAPKEYLIGKKLPANEQVSLTLWPLPLTKMRLLANINLDDPEKSIERIVEILQVLLRATDEQMERMHSKFFTQEEYIIDIIEAITDVLGATETKKKSRVKAIHEELKQKLEEVPTSG